MSLLGKMAIKHKLISIIMAVCITVLLLVGMMLIIWGQVDTRRSMVQSLLTQAEITADNCTAALAFNNAQDAESTLKALQAQESIVFAEVHTKSGGHFACYDRSGADKHVHIVYQEDGYSFGDGFLTVSKSIVLDGETIGSVFLRSDLQPLRTALRHAVDIIAFTVLVACLAAYFLSSRLQKIISGPILSLAKVARGVSENKDYSARAQKGSDDEVGMLTRAFNEMLEQIQEHQVSLTSTNEQLESRVQQRTAELSTTNERLEREITDRKQAEEKLREHDQLKTDFIVNVSHELKTPLAIFKNIISNLQAGVAGKMNDKQLKNLKVADKEIDRLTRIISDFLDISRIETGKIQLRLQHVAVQSLVSDVIELLGPLTNEKNMELTTLMPDADLFADIDRDRMVQVLANLISNAVKFVPDCGGRVTVRVKELDDEISIAVEDNGPGIEADDIDKIFDRFVQVEKYVGPGSHGTGVGLAISKELVELHGGRIEVQSKVGRGTTFAVILPLIRKCAAV